MEKDEVDAFLCVNASQIAKTTRALFNTFYHSKHLTLSVDGSSFDVKRCAEKGCVQLLIKESKYVYGRMNSIDGYFHIDLPVYCQSLLTNGVFSGKEPELTIINLLLDSKAVFLRAPDGHSVLPDEDFIDDVYRIEFAKCRCRNCERLEEEIARLRLELEELRLKERGMKGGEVGKIKEEVRKEEVRKEIEEEEKFTAPPTIKPVAQSGCGKGGIHLSTSGLTMSVDDGEAKKDLEFSIENVPNEQAQIIQEVIPASEIRSPLFKLGPHNVNFSVPIALEFEFKEGTERPALFIQEEEGVEIGALCRVPSLINGNKLTMKAKRFCNAFVAEDFNSKTGSSSTLNGPDVVSSGLNFRGKCITSSCPQKNRFVTYNEGYPIGPLPLNLLDPSYRQSIKCPICEQKFEPRQVLFCNASYTVQYSMKDDQPKEFFNHVVGPIIGVIGIPTSARVLQYSSFKVQVERTVCTDGVADSHSNGDACIDGAFDGKMSILFGTFCSDPDPYPCAAVIEAITRKGFKVELSLTPSDFTSRLPSFDIGSFVSGKVWTQGDQSTFITACLTHLQSGKGLYIWGDNDPYYEHANVILPKLFQFHLQGNTPGDKELALSYTLETGKFLPNHFITTGFRSLHEGITISYPSFGAVPPAGVNVLAHSTNGHPVILYSDKTSNGRGRVVIDCGFTKLGQREWSVTTGTARYVTNAFCWLTGVTVYNELYSIT